MSKTFLPFFQSSKNGIWTRFLECYFCPCAFAVFNETIDHNIIFHPENELKFKRRIDSLDKKTMLWQTKLFLKDEEPIIPSLVKASGCFILSDISTETVTVSKCLEANASFLLSPLCKKQKFTTSTPAKRSLFTEKDDVNDVETNNNVDMEINDDLDLSIEMSNLSITEHERNEDADELRELPDVLKSLKAADHLETYMKFNRMLAEDTFPFRNIAYLLFLDVVNWFSQDSTSQMRYDEDVKRFWRLGLKLFKGRFLKFMGGLKNTGQSKMKGVIHGSYAPSESKNNFAVPSRRVLDELQHLWALVHRE